MKTLGLSREFQTDDANVDAKFISTLTWRPDHARERFSLSRGSWLQANPGSSRYVVHSRAGYFGVEWLQDQALYR